MAFGDYADFKKSDDAIIHVSIDDEKAKALFPGFRTVKPYLRFTAVPQDTIS